VIDGITRITRSAAAVLAVATVVVIVLIVCNAAEFGSVELQRLREPTLILWTCALTAILLRREPGVAWTRMTSRLETWLGSSGGFRVVVLVGGVLIVVSSLTHHLAFNTYSLDLGLYQEALARAWEDPPLASTILGSSLLGEHFSPVLFPIAIVYQVMPSPLTLVVLNALLLWVAVFPLEAVGRELALPASVKNLVCLIYLFSPAVARSAGFPFHHEVLYPVVLFGLYLAFLRDHRISGALLVLAAVAIKEDAGLYLLGMGIFFGLQYRRWRWGAAVAIAGCLSTAIAVVWVIPHFSPGTAVFGPHGSWGPWFDPLDSTPAVRAMLSAFLTEDVLTVIAATLLVPLRGRWTWTVVAIPFLLNLTSSDPFQAQFARFYGLPLTATAAIAALAAITELPYSRSRGLRFAAAAVIINIAAFTYPSIPRCRGDVVAELARIDPTARVIMSASFDPLLQHVEHRELVLAGQRPNARVIVVRTGRHTWPLDKNQAAELVTWLESRPAFEERLRCDDFAIFERRPAKRMGGDRTPGSSTP